MPKNQTIAEKKSICSKKIDLLEQNQWLEKKRRAKIKIDLPWNENQWLEKLQRSKIKSICWFKNRCLETNDA